MSEITSTSLKRNGHSKMTTSSFCLSNFFDSFKASTKEKIALEMEDRQKAFKEIESLKSRLVKQDAKLAEMRADTEKSELQRKRMKEVAATLSEEMRAIQENATSTLRQLEENTREHERAMGEKEGVIAAQAAA